MTDHRDYNKLEERIRHLEAIQSRADHRTITTKSAPDNNDYAKLRYDVDQLKRARLTVVPSPDKPAINLPIPTVPSKTKELAAPSVYDTVETLKRELAALRQKYDKLEQSTYDILNMPDRRLFNPLQNDGLIRWNNLETEYHWLFNNGTANTWQCIANVTINEGLYAGSSYIMEIIEAKNSYGKNPDIRRKIYRFVITRSITSQNDTVSAVIYGSDATYMSVIKITAADYKILICNPVDYRILNVTMRSLGGNRTTTTYLPEPTVWDTSGSETYYYATQTLSDTFVPLSTPLTSTAWDGDAYSTTAKTLIDLSAVFTTPTAVPAGVKAVLVQVQCRDSASSGTATNYFSISPSSSADVHAIITRCSGMPNDYWASEVGVCPCDANGDIYYQCTASGTSTLDVYLQIWGYWL
ncbi:MAG TPA: hypothetical protein PL124_11390 [Candidatus Cloacimonadota bacterium]|nr:hypothetical protein [Candidatus Cloacimonadota bacterium]